MPIQTVVWLNCRLQYMYHVIKVSPICKKVVMFPTTGDTIWDNKKFRMAPFLFTCKITQPHYKYFCKQ